MDEHSKKLLEKMNAVVDDEDEPEEIIIDLQRCVDKVGETIADVFNNWTYRGGYIYQHKSLSRILVFLLTFLSLWAVVLIVILVLLKLDATIQFKIVLFFKVFGLSILISLISCIVIGGEYRKEVDYICLDEVSLNRTRIIIGLVDEDGCNSFIGLDLFQVLEQLEKIRH